MFVQLAYKRIGKGCYWDEEKLKRRNLSVYGYEYAFQSPTIIQKCKDTLSKRVKENPNYWQDRAEKMHHTISANVQLDPHYYDSTLSPWLIHVISKYIPEFNLSAALLSCRESILQRDPDYYKKIGQTAAQTRALCATLDPTYRLCINEKTAYTKGLHAAEDPEYYKKIFNKGLETRKQNYGSKDYMLLGSQSFYERMALLYNGNKTYNNSEKAAETRERKYGDRKAFQWGSPQQINYMIKHYGVKHNSQIHEFSIKQRQQYVYDGKYFSSAPEIALYIYLTDNHISFIYQPTANFWYEFNNQLHKYEPDFLIGHTYVEIKGNQFFENKDPTKHMICPYKKKEWTDEEYQLQCDKYEAKHQCMIKNHVVILTHTEYSIYVKYVNDKYGENYLLKFKKQKQ